jgi:hypothetical protein
VPHDRRAATLVAGIIQLARALGQTPLVEGIETLEQRQFLIELGCRLGQGYYFSKPVPAAEIRAYTAVKLTRGGLTPGGAHPMLPDRRCRSPTVECSAAMTGVSSNRRRPGPNTPSTYESLGDERDRTRSDVVLPPSAGPPGLKAASVLPMIRVAQ